MINFIFSSYQIISSFFINFFDNKIPNTIEINTTKIYVLISLNGILNINRALLYISIYN